MKELTFNHDAETVHEAFGVTSDDMATDIASCVSDFVRKGKDDDSQQSISRLGEMIHENIPYKTILLLATKEVYNTLEQFHDSMVQDFIKKITKEN